MKHGGRGGGEGGTGIVVRSGVHGLEQGQAGAVLYSVGREGEARGVSGGASAYLRVARDILSDEFNTHAVRVR